MKIHAPLSAAEMIGNIVKAEGRGRPMVAAFGLARLREYHEATNPGEPWADFARKNIPLGRDRVDELTGTMVHRNNLIRCVKCGVAVKCPCGCGVPYASEHPWANRDPLTKTVEGRVGRDGRRRTQRLVNETRHP